MSLTPGCRNRNLLIFPTGRQYFYVTMLIKIVGSMLGLCSPLGEKNHKEGERQKEKEGEEGKERERRRNYIYCALGDSWWGRSQRVICFFVHDSRSWLDTETTSMKETASPYIFKEFVFS